jgi:sugar/nucleoside kinase (ribokinase family)
MEILVVGSIALDNVETPRGKVKNALGGSATYFSFAASLFASVNIVGIIGDDFPSEYLDLFKKRGINLEGIEIRKGKTFRWEGKYEGNMAEAQTLRTELNLFSEFEPTLPLNYRKIDIVFLANIAPSLQLRVLKQLTHPQLIVCDTMNCWIRETRPELVEVFKNSKIIILNEGELKEFAGETNLIKASRAVLGLENHPRLIVKRGENGAVLFWDNSLFIVPGYPLEEVVDPTGAGDAFAGGSLGWLASQSSFSEFTLKESIIYGNVIASFVVENFSLQGLVKIGKETIKERVNALKKMTVLEK